MRKTKKIVALIPLKGKSKSIPRKNIKKLGGKPLCYWVCSAIKRSKYIEKIYVSTEDEEIKSIVDSFKFGVDFVPEKVMEEKNISVLESVIMNFMRHTDDFDILLTFQATSPLTTSEHIDLAIEKFLNKKYDSLLTGVLVKRFYWTKDAKPLNYDYKKRPLRQNFEGTILENGAFWITKKEILKEHKNRLGGKIGVYEMPSHTALELDEPEDWDEMEKIIKKLYGRTKRK